MTRVFKGKFWHQRTTYAALPDELRPYVGAELELFGRVGEIRWAIDTGSPYTILQPNDSDILLGQALRELDFTTHRQRIRIGGVGPGSTNAIIAPATLTFTDEQGQREMVRLPVLIAEPFPPYRSHGGNWRMPSLLGCDVLRHFDLALSYNPPSVSLTEAAPA
ncbi:MAG: hypothetical protein F4W96_11555 [Chloroflexi bacterium]|nr:hypothetical protein [Chloroflexota bacterium]